jgi:hypothetical protein
MLDGHETFVAGIEAAGGGGADLMPSLHGGSAWYDGGEEEGGGVGEGHATLQGLELAAMLEEKRRATATATATAAGAAAGAGAAGILPPPDGLEQSALQQQQLLPPPPPAESEGAALLAAAERVTVTGTEGLGELGRKMQLIADGLEVRKRCFCPTFYIKMIILPKQAQDKHGENSKESTVFL